MEELKKIPFPHSVSPSQPPVHGFVQKPFSFCTRNFNAKCTAHYESLSSEKEGFFVCPYGFSTYVKTINGSRRVFTSLDVVGKRSRRKLKRNRSHQDSNKSWKVDDFLSILDWFSAFEGTLNASRNLARDVGQKSQKVQIREETMEDALHELRKLNNMLKRNAFALNKELEGSGRTGEADRSIAHRARIIMSTSQLTSVRLNAYDFTINPDILEVQGKRNINIYKKFEKAKHCLVMLSGDRKLRIELSGQCHSMNECYEIVEILPFILLDNAIKFSAEKTTISCEFIMEAGHLKTIRLTNTGKIPKKDELRKILERGVRGDHAQNVAPGSGRGLYIAKLICDYHGYSLDIRTVEDSHETHYGIFEVSIGVA